MRFLIFLFVLFPSLIFGQENLNAMSFNIRYATPNDGVNQWENRKDMVASTISFYEASFCGLQEATKGQIDYLEMALPAYKWIGVGRDDGKEKGEFSPIFYDASILQVQNWKTVWLSETPDEPSKAWDAALPRVATIAHFKRSADQKEFVVINTHYDHRGENARTNSSILLIKIIKELQASNKPIVLMGDLNCRPEEKPFQTFIEGGLKSAFEVTQTKHYGPVSTFNGFQSKELENRRIDHIFVSPNVVVTKHASISQTWGGLFASDHYAILARIKF